MQCNDMTVPKTEPKPKLSSMRPSEPDQFEKKTNRFIFYAVNSVQLENVNNQMNGTDI